MTGYIFKLIDINIAGRTCPLTARTVQLKTTLDSILVRVHVIADDVNENGEVEQDG